MVKHDVEAQEVETVLLPLAPGTPIPPEIQYTRTRNFSTFCITNAVSCVGFLCWISGCTPPIPSRQYRAEYVLRVCASALSYGDWLRAFAIGVFCLYVRCCGCLLRECNTHMRYAHAVRVCTTRECYAYVLPVFATQIMCRCYANDVHVLRARGCQHTRMDRRRGSSSPGSKIQCRSVQGTV